MPLQIDISMGEGFDRLSILRLKLMKISEHTDPEKWNLVKEHYEELATPLKPVINNGTDMVPLALWGELFQINWDLWEVEDKLRECENKKEFDERFVELARHVYTLNDKRSAKKQEIDLFFNERVGEVKSYVELEKPDGNAG